MNNKFTKYTERYTVEAFNKKFVDNDNKVKYKKEDISFNFSDTFSDKTYDSVYSVNGMVGYMCPNCYTVQHMHTEADNKTTIRFDHVTDDDITEIEATKLDISVKYNVKTKCPICKYYKDHIVLDDNIADAIGILNIKGYYTSGSSEGHSGNDPYIVFDLKSHYSINAKSSIESYLESTLPISWYIDRPSFVMSYTYMSEDTLLRFPIRKWIPIYLYDYFVIRSDYSNKAEALKDILKWARSLRDLNFEEDEK